MGADRQPVRIVASHQLNLPWPNRLADTISEGPVWLLHGEGEVQNSDKWRDSGVNLIAVESTDGRLNPLEMLKKLGRAGLTSVFCEGGGSLAASLLQAGVVDELIVFSAGATLGAEGQPSVGALGISALADAPRFDLVEVRQIGNDVMQKWRRPSP